jgi:hypothetical protein
VTRRQISCKSATASLSIFAVPAKITGALLIRFQGKSEKIVMHKPLHHEHRSHSYERLEQAEGLMGWAAVVVALLVGAAVAIGMMTTTGHVTW